MDKFVTFMGYIQSFVVTPRINGTRERVNASSEQRNHTKNEANLPQEKSHPREGQNITKGSSGKGFNSRAGCSTGGEMEEEDGSSDRDGIFLRGEVEGARTSRPKGKMLVDNEQPQKFVNDKIDSGRSQAVLPPVDTVSNSYSNAARRLDDIGVKSAQCQLSATSPERLSQSVKKQTSLPSYSAARGLPHDQMTQQKTREDNTVERDLQRKNGLPDISFTEGKPLVQLRQPSIPNVPIRRKATPVLLEDTLSFDHVADDWSSPQKEEKSRFKLPKLKKKKNKRKSKEFGNPKTGGHCEQSEMAGAKEPKNPVDKGGKFSAVDSKCQVAEAEKFSEEKSVEGGGERLVVNGREQRRRRPRTALGRWLKKRSNSVAPAPFDDVISDSCHDGSKNGETETRTPDEYQEDRDKESKTLNGVKMAEEIIKEDATFYGQTSQSGARSGSEKVSLGVPSYDVDRDRDGLDKKDEHRDESVCSAGGYLSSCNVGGLHEEHDGKWKKLITLEMESGSFEAPTVSKKDYRSEPGKTIFVKQQVERLPASFSEETKHKEEASFCAENGYDHQRFCHKESPPPKARPRKDGVFSHKKKVRFNLEQEAAGGVPDDSAIERPMSSFFRHDRPAKKPSTFLQQFQELTNNDCSAAGTSEPPPPLPDCKPKWQGAGPCLPAIKPDKRQYWKKKELELKDNFEGWGELEPAEVRDILERPVSAKPPRYPAHWDPLPKERPPGRGGQGYCYPGVNWSKPERSALPESFCDGHDQSKVEESHTWCKFTRFSKSFYQNPPSRRVTEDNVDIQDVE